MRKSKTLEFMNSLNEKINKDNIEINKAIANPNLGKNKDKIRQAGYDIEYDGDLIKNSKTGKEIWPKNYSREERKKIDFKGKLDSKRENIPVTRRWLGDIKDNKVPKSASLKRNYYNRDEVESYSPQYNDDPKKSISDNINYYKKAVKDRDEAKDSAESNKESLGYYEKKVQDAQRELDWEKNYIKRKEKEADSAEQKRKDLMDKVRAKKTSTVKEGAKSLIKGLKRKLTESQKLNEEDVDDNFVDYAYNFIVDNLYDETGREEIPWNEIRQYIMIDLCDNYSENDDYIPTVDTMGEIRRRLRRSGYAILDESVKINESWTDVYSQFTDIIDKHNPDEENYENNINKEVEELYSGHKGEPDWDKAYEKWMNESLKESKQTLNGDPNIEYICIEDRQGGTWGVGRVMTAEEWGETASSWAESDGWEDPEEPLLKNFNSEQDCINFIQDLWEITIVPSTDPRAVEFIENTKNLKESEDTLLDDISWIIDEYDTDVTTKEDLGSDYYYHTLVKNTNEAEKFNYHSDYWGDADTYQEEMVDLVQQVEPYVGKVVTVDYDDENEVYKVLGVLIDKQYNSVSHAKILVEKPDDTINESEKQTLNEEAVGENITSPSGKFWIGDPCYVLSDDIYYGIWDDKYEFKDGKIDVDDKLSFLVHGTAYGDGCYEGTNGFEYGVDSGTLAVIPMDLVAKTDGVEFGTVEASSTAWLDYNDGEFDITLDDQSIQIQTSEEEDYEDDYEEDDYEEDDYEEDDLDESENNDQDNYGIVLFSKKLDGTYGLDVPIKYVEGNDNLIVADIPEDITPLSKESGIELVNQLNNQFPDDQWKLELWPINKIKQTPELWDNHKNEDLDESEETKELFIYSDANSENEQDAKANLSMFQQEAPNLKFKLRKDDNIYFIDFIGAKENIIDYLTKLGWYNKDEIENLDIIKPLEK